MAVEVSEIKVEVGCAVHWPGDDIDYAMVDRVREAIMPVLQRHGYEIPGVADLCAIAAVRELTEEAILIRPYARPL